MEYRLKTFISPVYYRSPANPRQAESNLVEFPNKAKQVCLLDELLEGGILIPESVLNGIKKNKTQTESPGLFVLLSGPPGSGKSTLALELCYRIAMKGNSGIGEIGKQKVSSMYVSSESSTNDLIQQAHSFGWDENEEVIVGWGKKNTQAGVYVYGREHVLVSAEALKKSPKEYFKLVHSNWASLVDSVDPYRASIIVFDSLNVLPKAWRLDDVMRALVDTCLRGPLLMIAVLDTGAGTESSEKPTEWDYFADMAIRVGYDVQESYLVRKIQIIKARYQDHADGEHRLKINAIPSPQMVRHPMSPFIKEGGVFVFPSVHRHLSVARREEKKDMDTSDTALRRESILTPFKHLNEIIQTRGLPCGYCTAIVGSRGGMKSHLAYCTLLKFLQENPKERALIISLRDAEEAALDTLSQIFENQTDDQNQPLYKGTVKYRDAKTELINYLDKDRLEILFFWPGYISPDEFFHLVRLAVDRAPKGKRVSLVVMNGLEQLSARFPLCAQEKMFVSGLVTLLCAKGTTNIVVSGGDVGAPPESGGVPAGLLQMADLIIESSFRLLPKKSVWSQKVWPEKHWCNALKEKLSQDRTVRWQEEPHVVYQVIRGPGAREMRKRDLFYMGRQDDPEPFHPGSVYVKQLPDDFPYGKTI